MLRIFLTSDIHLGMKFVTYPDIREKLREARFGTLERMVGIAGERRCDLFIVAGDLFDQVSVAKRDAARAAEILGEFQGKLVVVMPGNHDFFSGALEEPWATFGEHSGGNVLLTGKREVYGLEPFGLQVRIFPAVCHSKHSTENALGWIGDQPGSKGEGVNLGIAHGTVRGVSADLDGRFYPMDAAELLQCGLDLWAVGHSHVRYPEKPGPADRIFVSGTPEPDGFDCGHEGSAWILEVGDDRSVRATAVTTGQYRFVEEEASVESAEDLKRLEDLPSRFEGPRTLLRLSLKGTLTPEDYRLLPALRERLGREMLHFDMRDDGVTERITLERIDREFTEGSFPHRLLTSVAGDADVLQAAYEIIREVRR